MKNKKNNDKVSKLQSMLYEMAKADNTRKFHSLYDKVYRIDILYEAWNAVKINHGAPGVDGITIKEMEKDIDNSLKQLQDELREHRYKPEPLRRVYIPKANGKKRGLAIPTVRDRIVQAAIKMVIEPVFEPQFEPHSFGFRPDKSPHNAVDEIVKYLNYGCTHIIDADIRGCFDNIDRHKLMDRIAERVTDSSLLQLINMIINTGIMEDNEIIDTEKGTPQGSPLSPLLANIFLDQIDKAWKASGLWKGENAHLIRYADDLVILVGRNPAYPYEKLKQIISDIGLQLSEEKTRVVEAYDGFDFLGFNFTRKYSKKKHKNTTRWFPSQKSQKKIREKIRELTGNKARSTATPEEAKDKVIPILRGWGNYFSHSLASEVFNSVWNYAQDRLMYMYCHQHNIPSKWKNPKITQLHLSIMDTKPSTGKYIFPNRERHNAIS